MSSVHDIIGAIAHLQRAFMAAGLSTPVSIEVDPTTFMLLHRMVGRELELRPADVLGKRFTCSTGKAHIMLNGQRINECLV